MKRLLQIVSLVLLVAFAVGLTSCERGRLRGQGAECKAHSDCGPSFRCAAGACMPLSALPVSAKLISPAEGEVVSSSPVFVIGHTPAGVVRFFLDEQEHPVAHPEEAVEVTTFALPVTLTEGAHTARVTVTDTWGVSLTGRSTFQVDSTPPTILLPATISANSPTALVVEASDNVGIRKVVASITLNAEVVAVLGERSEEPYSFSWSGSLLAPGSYGVSVTAVDRAGNAVTATVPLTKAKALGATCAAAIECGSGFCVDNACCDRACDSACETCREPASVGTCRAVTEAPDRGLCEGENWCNTVGVCAERASPRGNLPGCTSAQTEAVMAGISLARRSLTVGFDSLNGCLVDAMAWDPPPFNSETNQFAESLLFDVAKLELLDLRCGQLGSDHEDEGIQVQETFQRAVFDVDMLDQTNPPATSAAILVASAMTLDRYSLVPPTRQSPSLNNVAYLSQLHHCAVEVGSGRTALPKGRPRSSFPFETTLAPVGTGGGRPAGLLACPSAIFATGVGGRADRFVRSFTVSCGGDAGGVEASTPAAGEGGGASFVRRCPPGHVMVGIEGRGGGWIDSVGPICAPRLGSELGPPIAQQEKAAGGDGGTSFRRTCPTGMAVKGVRARVDADVVYELQVYCQSLSSPIDISEVPSAVLGASDVEFDFQQRCTGREVMTGLNGWTVNSRGLSGLGGKCKAVTFDPSVASGFAWSEKTSSIPTRDPGSDPGDAFHDDCKEGKALVGMRLGLWSWAFSVQGLCADPQMWASGSNQVELSSLPLRGDETAPGSEAVCNRGSFLVGLRLHQGGMTDGIQLLCRRFR